MRETWCCGWFTVRTPFKVLSVQPTLVPRGGGSIIVIQLAKESLRSFASTELDLHCHIGFSIVPAFRASNDSVSCVMPSVHTTNDDSTMSVSIGSIQMPMSNSVNIEIASSLYGKDTIILPSHGSYRGGTKVIVMLPIPKSVKSNSAIYNSANSAIAKMGVPVLRFGDLDARGTMWTDDTKTALSCITPQGTYIRTYVGLVLCHVVVIFHI